MTVQRQYVGLMRWQLVVNEYFTPSCFIKNCRLYPITESSKPVHQNDIHILNEGIITDLIISNVVLNVFNAAVIPYCHIVQSYMTQSGMFPDASRQCKFSIKYTQFHFSRKTGVMNVLTIKPLCNWYISPIISQTRLAL